MRINHRDILFFTGGIALSGIIREISSPVIQIQTGAANTMSSSIDQIGVANTSNQQNNEMQRIVQPRFDNPFHIIQAIIPESLQNAYAPGKLLYNLTESMLEQSRPVRGNTQRLHSYIQKIRRKQCTTVIFAGGVSNPWP